MYFYIDIKESKTVHVSYLTNYIKLSQYNIWIDNLKKYLYYQAFIYIII